MPGSSNARLNWLLRLETSLEWVSDHLYITSLVLRLKSSAFIVTALHGGQVPEEICLKPSCAFCLMCTFSLGLCTFAYTRRTRDDIRQKYDLPAQPCGDCCVHFWYEEPTESNKCSHFHGFALFIIL